MKVILNEPAKRPTIELHDISSKNISHFVTANTRRFFTHIGSSAEQLEADPSIWNERDDFIEAYDSKISY